MRFPLARTHRLLACLLLALGFAGSAQAQGLVALYEMARAFDATYLAARAQADAAEYRAAQTNALGLPTLNANLRGVSAQVDLPRFMGDWYVFAHIPYSLEKGKVGTLDRYALRPDGRIQNSYLFRRGSLDAPLEEWKGVAWVKDEKTNAEWRVQFVWPFRVPFLVIDFLVSSVLMALGHDPAAATHHAQARHAACRSTALGGRERWCGQCRVVARTPVHGFRMFGGAHRSWAARAGERCRSRVR